MKLIPFLSQSKSLDSNPTTTWPFPSCGNIKTLSFRDNNLYKNDNFRTFNSAFLDTSHVSSSSSSRTTFSTMSDDIPVNNNDPIDNVSIINGLRSDRLFFEPQHSCSLVQKIPLKEEEEEEEEGWVEESEAMCMESNNPCEDFRKSMEEMVQVHELKDWQELEELLGCYLKINAKTNHGYIMGAFIDLLVNLSFITTTTNTNTNSTTNTITNTTLSSSSFTTPSLSSLFEDDDR